MQNLPTETATTESYSDYDSHKDHAISEEAQASLPTDWEENNDTLDKTKGTHEFPTPLQSNEVPGAPAEHEVGHPLQNAEPVTNGNHVVDEEAHLFDNLIASDGTQSLASPPPLLISSEYAQVSYAPSSKLDDAGPLEGIPDVKETSDPKMALSENQHLDETVTSDAMVLDSDDVVPIQDISDSGVVAAFHPEGKDIEQNPQIHDKDEELSPSRLPDYMEHVSADGMRPLGSNELSMAMETCEPGDEEETIVEDLYNRESELENQNKSFNSTPPGQYFSSAGIPAPSLVSTASQVPAAQIVIPASVDPTQENAIAALQILKVYFVSNCHSI